MISLIYDAIEQDVPEDIRTAFKKVFDRAVERKTKIPVFFRADDIGVFSKNYDQLVSLFIKYQVPICGSTRSTASERLVEASCRTRRF